jgi:hypothetical protein
MDFDRFQESLAASAPPAGLSTPLQALWHDGKGDWNAAHDRLQDDAGPESAWVHAYLHRKEGDLSNAGYWYRRAGQPTATSSLSEEWTSLVQTLLADGKP